MQGCDGTGVELGVEHETCVLETAGEDVNELDDTSELVIELAFGVVEGPVELSTVDVLADKELGRAMVLVECCGVDCTTD